MRKKEERSGGDLVRRDEKRMRRGADSRIKKKERMKERKAITERRRQTGSGDGWAGGRAGGERSDLNMGRKGMGIIWRQRQ